MFYIGPNSCIVIMMRLFVLISICFLHPVYGFHNTAPFFYGKSDNTPKSSILIFGRKNSNFLSDQQKSEQPFWQQVFLAAAPGLLNAVVVISVSASLFAITTAAPLLETKAWKVESVQGIEKSFATLKSDIKSDTTAFWKDISALHSDIKSDIATFTSNVENDIATVRQTLKDNLAKDNVAIADECETGIVNTFTTDSASL